MLKKAVYDKVDGLHQEGIDMARYLWNVPEVGGQERASAAYLKDYLQNKGFRITLESAIPYAFYAEAGFGHPVIGILGEYDALPGLSQSVRPVREPVVPNGPGHGCGHNLLGTAGVLAATAIKQVMEQQGISGTIRFYGCPEEELLSGKVKMAFYHMFDGCDFALSWHPLNANIVYDRSYLANVSVRFFFSGKAAHASFAPERGRSALDAVELMSVGTNYLREHISEKARIHYTTDSGGFPPNIVPDRASAWYFVRAPRMAEVREILTRMEKIAKGAALMTETAVVTEYGYGCCEMVVNRAFADLTYSNMQQAELPQYTEDELKFAKSLIDMLDPDALKFERSTYECDGPIYKGLARRDLWRDTPLTGSSDSGDVSQIIPMNLFSTACWPVGCTSHSWQATAATGSTIAEKGMLYAAKVLAGTAFDLATDAAAAERITAEFRGNADLNYKPFYNVKPLD